MRMWLVPAEGMCRQHLLGEHVELHMAAGAIMKNRNIDGFLKKGLICPALITQRHGQLVNEMMKRGYHHHSDMMRWELYYQTHYNMIPKSYTEIPYEKRLGELVARCPECRGRQEGVKECK